MGTQNPEGGTIIVGGGLAGLTAASYIARSGHPVTLFEQAPELGGRGTSKDHDGFQFNMGIHALYTGGAASEVLADLGVEFSGDSPTDVQILHDGEFYQAPTTPRTIATSRFFTVSEKIKLVRLFIRIARTKAENVSDMSVQEWLDVNIKRPRLRSFFEANARTLVYSDALHLVSADVFIRKTQLAFKNPVIYIDGGWKTLVDGLQKTAEAEGVHIHTGTRVDSVEVDGGTVQGVLLQNSETVDASSVILATPPTQAAKLVPSGDKNRIAAVVDSMIPAHVACLTVALDRLPNPDYAIVQDLDQPRFMSTQSLYSQVTPEGAELIYTFKQLDPLHDGDFRRDEHDLETLLDKAQPGWRSMLVERQFLPRIPAIGMLPTTETGGYNGRPHPDATGVNGLYVAGDWVGPGFLSDASFGSGREVAKLILDPPTHGDDPRKAVSPLDNE